MPVELIADPGAEDANSYATLEEANAYIDTRLFADAWIASGDTPAKALIMATRLLDAHYQWTGLAASATQSLEWPRTGMLDRRGNAVPSDEIPQLLKDATTEFALQLLAGDRSLDSDIESQKITSLTAGPVSLTFAEGVEAKVIPDAVQNLLLDSWYVDEDNEDVIDGTNLFRVFRPIRNGA